MLPDRTKEQRAEALALAMRCRRDRTEFLRLCKKGDVPPRVAVENPAIGRVRVKRFLMAFPGIGESKAEMIMMRAGIADVKRVGGLGCRQLPRMLDQLEMEMD